MAIKFKKVNSIPSNPTTADDGVYFVKMTNGQYQQSIISGGEVIHSNSIQDRGRIPSGSDFNDYITNGIYFTSPSSSGYINCPAGDSPGLGMLIVKRTSNNLVQKYIQQLGSPVVDNVYFRKSPNIPVNFSPWFTYVTREWVQNQGYITTESDPIFTSSPAFGITNTDITNWDGKGTKLVADQPNAIIRLQDSSGNNISSINVGFLNNEGTTIFFNSATDEIELQDDQGNVLSSFPASSLVSNVASGLDLTGATLKLLDNSNNELDSVTLTISNIQGLQAALDSKTPFIPDIADMNGVSEETVVTLSGATDHSAYPLRAGIGFTSWGGANGVQMALMNGEGAYIRTNNGLTDTDYSAWVQVADRGWTSSNFDNYQSWNLKTNGTQRKTIQSGQYLDIVEGTDISVDYLAGGGVKINSTPADSGWTGVSFNPSTIYPAPPESDVRVKKIGNKLIIKGLFFPTPGNTSPLVFTLPSGYRPDVLRTVSFFDSNNQKFVGAQINTNGEVSLLVDPTGDVFIYVDVEITQNIGSF